MLIIYYVLAQRYALLYCFGSYIYQIPDSQNKARKTLFMLCLSRV